MVVAACQETHVVHHGQAGGEELDGPRQEVMAGVPMQRAEVGAVVLVGGPDVGPLRRLIEVLHVRGAAQTVLYNLLQLVHIAHLWSMHAAACCPADTTYFHPPVLLLG